MDKEQPVNRRVSIVIPVYNSSKTLPKCLDSMIAQTYQDLEIICVNDCSKDNSWDIIKEYQHKDSRIKLVNHTENMNAGGARNSGIKAATGTYVCFVDNDDWMSPDAIEILIMESDNCTIDYVAPDWCEWYNDDKHENHSNLIENASKTQNCEYALKFGSRMLGCLIRRDIFFKNDMFFPERIFWEDNAIGIALLYSVNQIKAVKRVLYYYYISPGSSSRSFNLRKTSDRIKTTQIAFDNLKRLGYLTSDNEECVNYFILRLSYFSIRMLAINHSKEAEELLQTVIEFTRPMLPNKYLSKLGKYYKWTLSHPMAAYRVWTIGYWLRNVFIQ